MTRAHLTEYERAVLRHVAAGGNPFGQIPGRRAVCKMGQRRRALVHLKDRGFAECVGWTLTCDGTWKATDAGRAQVAEWSEEEAT